MYQQNFTQRSLRSILLLGAASAFAVGMAAPAAADTVETVVVTGSLIPTPNATSNSPIQTVGAEAIDLSGHPNVEEIVNQLPQIVPGLGAFSNNPGGGEAVIDLRGLSPNRNLILVDGRRAMTTAITGEVDINTIPAAMIDHIDVVSGGGSATYGSDAISGVVNFVMKKDFEGFQASARYGEEVEHSFAPEKSLNVLMGVNTADGKGNVTMFAEWFKRAEVLQGEDPRFLLDMGGGATQGGSATPPGAALGAPGSGSGLPALPQGGSGSCGGVNAQYAFNSAGAPEGFCSRLAPSNNAFANAQYNRIVGGQDGITLNPEGDRYNFAPTNDLVTPDRRVSFAANGHYDIFPGIEFYGNLHYVDNVVGNSLAPTPVTAQPGFAFAVFPKASCASTGPGTGGTLPGNGVAGCDPTLPGFYFNSASTGGIGTTAYVSPVLQHQFDLRATTQIDSTCDPTKTTCATYGYSPIPVAWRSAQLGARTATFTTDEYQITGGFQGQFGKSFGGWDWNAYYDVGRTEFSDVGNHNVLASHLMAAMQGCPPGSPSSLSATCAPVDIFGAGNLSPAATRYIDYTTTDRTTYDRQVVHGETHGDLFDLPAGPLSLALGAEYRKDEGAFTPDQAKQNFDIQGFNGALATKGSYNVSEVFAETRIPILSDMAFAQYLGLEGGYRYSDYSGSGSLSTWKAGGEWQPIDDIRFRAMWQRAARAPNLFELFNGGAQGFPAFTDPCQNLDVTATASTPVGKACHTQFEVAGAHGAESTSYQAQNGQFQTVAFGNNNLTPEKSNTMTLGTVITPSFLPGVTASVDYYHIAINNFIGLADGGAPGIANACLAAIQAGTPIPGFLTVPNPANPANTHVTAANVCQYVTRLPTGDAVYTVPNANTNNGDVSTGGLDFQVSAQHDVADLVGSSSDYGAVDLSVSLSLLTQFFDPNGAGNCGSTNLKGTVDFCGTTVFATADIRPNIRWNTHLGYTFEDWRAQLTWNHIGSVNDNFFEGPLGFGFPHYVIPSYDTFDLAIRWNFSEHYSADLVINNLFDKGPPLGMYAAVGGINTIAEAYDVLGRQASIQLTAKL